MKNLDFENEIRQQWDYWNNEGVILYQYETLTTRKIEYGDIELHLIHNACRDVYDRSTKAIDKPGSKKKPFADGSNPELAQTENNKFKIVGNRFACMQYQSVLVPVIEQTELNHQFLNASIQFALGHPNITLMYNSLGAGKTVPNQYWLLSFHQYETLDPKQPVYQSLGSVKGHHFYKRQEPCYMVVFDIENKLSQATEVLHHLISYVEQKNFNVFIFSNRIYFIPREDIEIPDGFENHRFGGLEMIGYFIMKSLDLLEAAKPEPLLKGIQQISFQEENQLKFEDFLLNKLA